MGIFDRIHAFFWGNDREDADRSRQASESETNPPAFPTPQYPDRELEDANGVRAEPTWEAVEWYLEKTVDADECRDAFRLYYESGEVRDLDSFSRESC